MSHVVMQAAEFPSIDLAERCERELSALVADYARFEATDPAAFLRDEDFEDQFTVCDGADPPADLFTLTAIGRGHRRRLACDDSGVQDRAFVALLPQLCDEDPTLLHAP